MTGADPSHAHVIRMAEAADAGAIAEIYNHYIEHSTVTFHMHKVDRIERRAWMAGHDQVHPICVVEDGGRVVAWGALTPWAERLGWRHTVEISTYVGIGDRRRGLGRALMEELVRRAVEIGHHAVVAQIVGENEASIALCESMGFERAGCLREVGRKFDRWLDVVLMERII